MLNGEKTAFPTGAENPNYEGLTKREYFAATALQGLLSNPFFMKERDNLNPVDVAIEWADDLLDKLRK